MGSLLLIFALCSFLNWSQANDVEAGKFNPDDVIPGQMLRTKDLKLYFDLKFTDGFERDISKSDEKKDGIQQFRYVRSADQPTNETDDSTLSNIDNTINHQTPQTIIINQTEEMQTISIVSTTSNPTDETEHFSDNDPLLLHWMPWSECVAVECGQNGTRQRNRRCVWEEETYFDETICQAAVVETEACVEPCSTEPPWNLSRWLEWSEWTECSVTCGVGYQHRQRRCENEETRYCEGRSNDTKLCQVPCVWWGNWTQWTSCSRTCGSNGTQLRRRLCKGQRVFTVIDAEGDSSDVLKRIPQRDLDRNQVRALAINSSLCPGGEAAALETKPCSPQARCAARWSKWGNWSQCSSSCGIGFQTANRRCLGNSRSACRGNSVKYQRCYSPSCWSTWSEYSACSRSCGSGGGYQTRARRCVGTNGNRPQYRVCAGDTTQRRRCNVQACPVWGGWTKFGRCSKTCGSGVMMRTRRCIRGNCGKNTISKRSCNNQPCPSWSEWSSYSCCSQTCGSNGLKNRKRKCQYARRTSDCPGRPNEQVRCFLRPCSANVTSVFDTFQCGYYPTQQTTAPVLRILGGRVSRPNKWPWQGSWQHKTCSYCDWVHFCGATLVAPGWAITASHCIKETIFEVNFNDPGNSWSVVLGMHRLYNDGTRHFLKRIYVHPNYRYTEVTIADIALLKLRRPAPLSSKINPVCMPPNRLPAAGTSCFVTGWGYTESPTNARPQLSKVLKEARVPLMSFPSCQRLGWIYRKYLNNRDHMCAGNPTSARADSCTGDSGGPLVCKYSDNKWYLSGITSFGFTSCGKRGHAGIYVPVHRYKSWIRTTIDKVERGIC